jgi:hypothetical protein
LKNLRDLNVANNVLRFLPSELIQLPLTSLIVHPNPFYPCPREVEVGLKYFGELIIHHAGVPHLRELSLRRLIRPMTADEDRSVLEKLYALPLPNSEALGVPHEISMALNPAPKDFTNPFHCVCPSPRHEQMHESVPIFVDPVVERFEWIDRVGELPVSAPRVPIRWRGCSRGCLNFLEDGCVEKNEKKELAQVAGFGPNGESFEFSDEE